MKITTTDIAKNGIWLMFPPLIFSLSLMSHLPAALTPALFNKDVPDVLLNGESIVRILVFALPVFFSIGISTKTQKQGLALYLVGIALYYLSYKMLIFFPDSVWSTSMIGFVAPAYTNLFWMIGLGLLGEKFYFPAHLRYCPVFLLLRWLFFSPFTLCTRLSYISRVSNFHITHFL